MFIIIVKKMAVQVVAEVKLLLEVQVILHQQVHHKVLMEEMVQVLVHVTIIEKKPVAVEVQLL